MTNEKKVEEKSGLSLPKLDERVIYWALVVLLLLPFFVNMGIPLPLSPMTQEFYDYVDRLKPDSVILYSVDFGPGSLPEIEGSIVAVSKQIASKPIKVVIISVWEPTAAPVNEEKIVSVFKAAGKTYGVDYVNFGFLPGGEGAVARLADDFKGILKVDYYGNSIEDLPMMQNIKDATSFTMVIDGGFPSWLYMRQNWVPKYNIPLISIEAAGSAVEVRSMYPFSLKAILGGARAGAEYEVLIKSPGVAKKGLDSVTFGVILFVGTIALGNVIYVRSRRKK